MKIYTIVNLQHLIGRVKLSKAFLPIGILLGIVPKITIYKRKGNNTVENLSGKAYNQW